MSSSFINDVLRFFFPQGLQICILYTFRSPIFKKKVSEVFSVLRVPGIQIYLHSEIQHVSKSQPAKHSQGIFRLSEISTENISLSTLPNGCQKLVNILNIILLFFFFRGLLYVDFTGILNDKHTVPTAGSLEQILRQEQQE